MKKGTISTIFGGRSRLFSNPTLSVLCPTAALPHFSPCWIWTSSPSCPVFPGNKSVVSSRASGGGVGKYNLTGSVYTDFWKDPLVLPLGMFCTSTLIPLKLLGVRWVSLFSTVPHHQSTKSELALPAFAVAVFPLTIFPQYSEAFLLPFPHFLSLSFWVFIIKKPKILSF